MLEKGDQGLGWIVARVPFVPAEVWPERVRLRVRGTANGAEFRSSLFPAAGGGLCVLVSGALQQAAGVGLGGSAEFVLEPDMEAREAELPDELAVLLDEEPGLRAWYAALSEYKRREIGKWVNGVKSEEARLRRAMQMGERLLATMEAEIALPPWIERAFQRRPKARMGWAKMTAAQRQGELMGVFNYQTPEAREKRLGKLCDAAEKRA